MVPFWSFFNFTPENYWELEQLETLENHKRRPSTLCRKVDTICFEQSHARPWLPTDINLRDGLLYGELVAYCARSLLCFYTFYLRTLHLHKVYLSMLRFSTLEAKMSLKYTLLHQMQIR